MAIRRAAGVAPVLSGLQPALRYPTRVAIRSPCASRVPATRWQTTLPVLGRAAALPLSRSRGLVANSRANTLAVRLYSTKKKQEDEDGPLAEVLEWQFEEIREALRSGRRDVIFVDVREPHELFETGKIPGAVNIPITSAIQSFHISGEDFHAMYGFRRPGSLRGGPGKQSLVFYCKAGVRAKAAAALAQDAGYGALGVYSGSWLEWDARQGPVERVVKGPGDGGAGTPQELRDPKFKAEWVRRKEKRAAELDSDVLVWDPASSKFKKRPAAPEEALAEAEAQTAMGETEVQEAAAPADGEPRVASKGHMPVPRASRRSEAGGYWDPYKGRFIEDGLTPEEREAQTRIKDDDPRLKPVPRGDSFAEQLKTSRKDAARKSKKP